MISEHPVAAPAVRQRPQRGPEGETQVIDDLALHAPGIVSEHGPHPVYRDLVKFPGRLEQPIAVAAENPVPGITRNLSQHLHFMAGAPPLRRQIIDQKLFREEAFRQNQNLHRRLNALIRRLPSD